MGYEIVALGELLIDFTQFGISPQDNFLFEANPGGAPCNVLAMLSRLGHSTAFIGKVGDDMFGHLLAEAISSCGIATDGLKLDGNVNTTLAFVRKLENGDRDFSFYRHPGADMMLRKADIREDIISDARIFHFGSLSMTNAECAEATRHAIDIAEKHSLIRSFDPNLRPPLWSSLKKAKEMIRFGLAHCDILKISDNEIVWLTDMEDYSEGVMAIRKEFDIPLILVSEGRNGSRAYWKEHMVKADAFRLPDTIETTGAGDTFCAMILHHVLQNGLHSLDEKSAADMLIRANAAAAVVTTRYGALRAMPTESEIDALIGRG